VEGFAREGTSSRTSRGNQGGILQEVFWEYPAVSRRALAGKSRASLALIGPSRLFGSRGPEPQPTQSRNTEEKTEESRAKQILKNQGLKDPGPIFRCLADQIG